MSEITTPAEFEKLKLACVQSVMKYVDLANQKLGIKLDYPMVTFDLRGTTAGRAWYHKNRIQFQPTLLFQNPDDFLVQTAGHEVGHLAAFTHYRNQKIAPHGPEWGSVMNYLGLPSTRCHNYDTNSVSTRLSKRTPANKVVYHNGAGMARLDSGIVVVDLD